MHISISKIACNFRAKCAACNYVYCYVPLGSTLKQTMLCSASRQFSSAVSAETQSFQDIISFRKRQAECSVLVELTSSHSHSDIYDLCSSNGTPKQVIRLKNSRERNFQLLEFSDSHTANNFLNRCNYQGPHNGLPTFSRLLYYQSLKKSSKNNASPPDEAQSDNSLSNNNNTAADSSFVLEQMNIIHKTDKLGDVDIRLRFLMCTVLEDAMKGIFPHCKFIPVGSTVNGLGNKKSDLDVVLAVNSKFSLCDSKFCHPSKKVQSSYNNVDSHLLGVLDGILKTFLPGVSGVKKNMLSLPPSVRFKHNILDLWCSLTINDINSLYISEVLFLCAELNQCIRPLVFTVKQWAHRAKVTSNCDESGITDFALTLIIIFFLQTCPSPVIPPLDQVHLLGKTRNFNGQTYEKIDSLLKDFFHFLCSFQFKNKAISVNSAQDGIKPDFSPLYLHNPGNQQSNLCKNVTQKEINHLVEAANCALWNLETILQSSMNKSKNLTEVLLSDVGQSISVKC